MQNIKYRVTQKSRNKKTGPIMVTTSEQKSCPAACPLKNNGCYADSGPLALVWRDVAKVGTDINGLSDKIKTVKDGDIWRHNQAGDLAHNREAIKATHLAAIVKANQGKRGFTYTHHDMAKGNNAHLVRNANRAGFTINLSGNNPDHADALVDLDCGPVVTILPESAQELTTTKTPKGRKIVICPATNGRSKNCQQCKLCAIPHRGFIVGFPAHGISKRKAEAV